MTLTLPLGEFVALQVRRPMEIMVRHELERNTEGKLVWRTFEAKPHYLYPGEPLTEIELEEKGE